MKRRKLSGYPVQFKMQTLLQPAWMHDKEREVECGWIRHTVHNTIMIAYESDYDGDTYYEKS